jgi:hypothetical protein
VNELIKLIAGNPVYFGKRISQKIRFNLIDWYLFNQNQSNEAIVNRLKIRVCGLRRAGNHAIINWIIQQSNGNVVHLNDIFLRENPYRFAFEGLQTKNPQFYWKAYRIRSNPLYAGENYMELLKNEMRRDFIKKDMLIYSLEDYRLKLMKKRSIYKKHLLFFGGSEMQRDILILRDPYNLLASRLKHKHIGLKTRSVLRSFAEMWIDYAKEFLGETNHLKNNKFLINYNQWSRNYSYRKELAENLGLNFTDAGFNNITNYGGGSSFNGTNPNQKLDVAARWKAFTNDPVYLKALSQKDLIKYADRIYPELSFVKEKLDLLI